MQTDLFSFNSGSILFAETELGDGNVIKDDIEISRTFCQFTTHEQGNLLSLCDQLWGIEFGNNTFQDFITNRGKDFFIVIQA